MKLKKSKGKQMESFGEWLTEQLRIRGWIQSDLEQASGLRHGTISNLISGNKKPGPKSALAIARALKLPPDIVYKEAGLLPSTEGEKKEGRRDAWARNLIERAQKLTPEDQAELDYWIEYKLKRKKKQASSRLTRKLAI